MVFSSPIFLSIFLPTLLVVYLVAPRIARNIILTIFSLAFYAWGEPYAVWALVGLTAFTYLVALAIEVGKGWNRVLALSIGVVVDIGTLVVYKYLGFIIENINALLDMTGLAVQLPETHIALPIGISFYVFQLLSYMVDVYRGSVSSQRNPLRLLLYVGLFPQLIAGPIVRYSTVVSDIANRAIVATNIFSGARRFSVGLAKKVLIADVMAEVADGIFGGAIAQTPCFWCWVGAFAYTMQIYFDFSGYSDMAIGLGRMFNFKFLENFDHPYCATSIQEFWRRWHISLSTWFRDYLYIPLGGNRKGLIRTYVNLFVVFLLCGIWHGAAWTFLVWGLYHGIGIVVERIGFGKFVARFPKVLGNMYTFLFVVVGWVIFRSNTLEAAWQFLGIMFRGNACASGLAFSRALPLVSVKVLVVFGIAVVASYPQISSFCLKAPTWLKSISAFILFAVAFMFAVTSGYSPFIYFRF